MSVPLGVPSTVCSVYSTSESGIAGRVGMVETVMID